MKPSLTREALIARLKEIAAQIGGRTVPRAVFHRMSGLSDRQYLRCFGSYNDMVRAAGLEPYIGNRRVSDEILLQGLHRAWMRVGGPVPHSQVYRWADHPVRAYTRRWKSWPGVLSAFRLWLLENDPAFPFMPALAEQQRRADLQAARHPAGSVRSCGPVIHFRGMLHAPTNEHGVVLLFGIVATELGFLVESVGPSFPDCEAKRLVKDGWERQRIEFELRSANFPQHGHDASACDLIVCWEHDWPECPVEVLELKSTIEGLRVPKPPHLTPALSAPQGRRGSEREREREVGTSDE